MNERKWYIAAFVALIPAILISCSKAPSSTVEPTAAISTTMIATAAPTLENTVGIDEIITADEIAQVYGKKPSKYDEIVKPNSSRKIGTYTFDVKMSTGVNMYMELGLVIGNDNIKKYNYREPAVPRLDSTITEYDVLGTKSYLDTQYADVIINDKTVRIINNLQLICIYEGNYYYVSTGYIPDGEESAYIAKLPALLEKFILNSKARVFAVK